MITLSVENLTISGFIEKLNTQTFSIEELDRFIKEFYIHVRNAAINDGLIKAKQLAVIDKAEKNRKLKQEYDDLMDGIDERILDRSIYMEEVYKKYKYSGKYKKNGNSKRETCNNQPKGCKQVQTAIQFCFMQESQE